MRIDRILNGLRFSEVGEDSFKTFHANGLTYINLVRTPHYTAKLYHIKPWEFDRSSIEMLVNPHTHNYFFKTTVLSGFITNKLFETSPNPQGLWDFCSWSSKLNGGSGAKLLTSCDLTETNASKYHPNSFYYLKPNDIHTIWTECETVLLLEQYEDETETSHYFTQSFKNDECHYAKFLHAEDFDKSLIEIKKIINE